MSPQISDLDFRIKRIKLLLMDYDGVLTDGQFEVSENGDEKKSFNARDGQGISLFQRAGWKTGIISGRKSSAVERHAQAHKMAFVRQFAKVKIPALEEILAKADVLPQECAYIGDDLADIPIMQRVGLAIAVADAVAETRQAAHYVTQLKGGCGAVREVTDLILKTQGRWDELVKRFGL